MKITLHHARSYPCRTKMGFCSPMMHKFAERYGIDWNEFVANGIDDEILLATGDAMAKRLVDWVKQNNGG